MPKHPIYGLFSSKIHISWPPNDAPYRVRYLLVAYKYPKGIGAVSRDTTYPWGVAPSPIPPLRRGVGKRISTCMPKVLQENTCAGLGAARDPTVSGVG